MKKLCLLVLALSAASFAHAAQSIPPGEGKCITYLDERFEDGGTCWNLGGQGQIIDYYTRECTECDDRKVTCTAWELSGSQCV